MTGELPGQQESSNGFSTRLYLVPRENRGPRFRPAVRLAGDSGGRKAIAITEVKVLHARPSTLENLPTLFPTCAAGCGRLARVLPRSGELL
jgi:hypothetical protein